MVDVGATATPRGEGDAADSDSGSRKTMKVEMMMLRMVQNEPTAPMTTP